eukprot:431736-Pleurochrysis_carterae.AAC.1
MTATSVATVLTCTSLRLCRTGQYASADTETAALSKTSRSISLSKALSRTPPGPTPFRKHARLRRERTYTQAKALPASVDGVKSP